MFFQFRLAEAKDIDQLIHMHWDFTYEYTPSMIARFEDFYMECQTFLEEALITDRWFIWVAELDSRIVSHIYIELIEKVPRPGRITHPFAYMTNVYTIPKYRSKGIGGNLLKRGLTDSFSSFFILNAMTWIPKLGIGILLRIHTCVL